MHLCDRAKKKPLDIRSLNRHLVCVDLKMWFGHIQNAALSSLFLNVKTTARLSLSFLQIGVLLSMQIRYSLWSEESLTHMSDIFRLAESV